MSEELNPNFTSVPNVFVDYWLPRLKSTSFAILIVLSRKTFGWHKTTDSISRNQLMECSGLSKNTVKRALDELDSHGILNRICVTDQFGCQPNRYTLNVIKPVDERYSTPDQVIPPRINVDRGRSTMDRSWYQKMPPQKKDQQKKVKETPTVQRKHSHFVGCGSVIFSHGEHGNCKLTASEHEKLLEKMGIEELDYWLEEIDIAIGRCGGPKAFNAHYATHADTHFYIIQAWRRTRKSKGQHIGTASGFPNYNQAYALEVEETYGLTARRRGCRIEVCSTYVEIIPTTNACISTIISFTEKGFKEQLDNALRKWRLK